MVLSVCEGHTLPLKREQSIRPIKSSAGTEEWCKGQVDGCG
jgi:hypothetical protein